MLSFALKFIVADICINSIFNKIESNLTLTNESTYIPRVGDVLKSVEHKFGNETYYQCVVTAVEEILNVPGEYIVYIKFTAKSSDIDDDFGFEFDEAIDVTQLSDDDLKEYLAETIELDDDELDNITREELEELINESDMDLSDVDLIETSDANEVGVSSIFFNFLK